MGAPYGRRDGREPLTVFLEVIATTADDGVEAEAGGADRLEVVRELDRGGLTPPLDVVESLLARVRLPLRVMVRVEEPFVPSSPAAIAAMCDEARRLAALPIDGVVFGAVRTDHTIDLDVLQRLAEAAAPRRVTFHRAFELAPDPAAALRDLAGVAAVDRVLTSAGEGSAEDRVRCLRRWRTDAGPRPALLFAAGLDPAARWLAAAAEFEVHVGRAARAGQRIDGPVTAEAVARLKTRHTEE